MSFDRKKRVILADDHNLVRSGLAALLTQDGRFHVVAEATDGIETLERLGDTPCDLLIVDLAMPRLGGIEVIGKVRQRDRQTKILVLSMYDDAQFVARAMKAGANGYLLKHALDEDLFHAIEAIFDDAEFISPLIDQDALREFSFDNSELTARETEVLHLIAEGKTNSQIAEILIISPHTVTRHRANLMKKLNVHNRVDLVKVASSRGLIMIPPARG